MITVIEPQQDSCSYHALISAWWVGETRYGCVIFWQWNGCGCSAFSALMTIIQVADLDFDLWQTWYWSLFEAWTDHYSQTLGLYYGNDIHKPDACKSSQWHFGAVCMIQIMRTMMMMYYNKHAARAISCNAFGTAIVNVHQCHWHHWKGHLSIWMWYLHKKCCTLGAWLWWFDIWHMIVYHSIMPHNQWWSVKKQGLERVNNSCLVAWLAISSQIIHHSDGSIDCRY